MRRAASNRRSALTTSGAVRTARISSACRSRVNGNANDAITSSILTLALPVLSFVVAIVLAADDEGIVVDEYCFSIVKIDDDDDFDSGCMACDENNDDSGSRR
jgi:hypothetical protein